MASKQAEWARNKRATDPEWTQRHNAGRRAAYTSEQRFAQRLRLYHGMTVEDFEAMWDAQGGRCYLCRGVLDRGQKTCIEHDHRCCETGFSCEQCRRGLACRECNSVIGLAGDDPSRLRLIADNLETANRLLELGGL